MFLGAKVRGFHDVDNRPFMAFCIPMMWYAIYHPCGIVVSTKSPYLCTQISISNLNRQKYGKDLCKWRRAGSEPAAQCE